MRDALIVSAFSLLPRSTTARWMGVFARTGLSRLVTRAFVTAYGVRLDEAEGTLADYPTLDALFTRRLRPGLRPIHPTGLVSPVDGTVAWVGTTVGQQFDVAPGRPLSVPDLLGEPCDGERDVAVVYLSPTDYHRVHHPTDGQIVAWRYVPGTLWPVFPAAVRTVTGLFARNERAVATLSTPQGRHDVVLVGAFGVGRMELVFTDLLTNTGAGARAELLSAPIPVTRGDDLGVFHLGSTVVIVAPAGTWRWEVRPGEAVRLGRPLAEPA